MNITKNWDSPSIANAVNNTVEEEALHALVPKVSLRFHPITDFAWRKPFRPLLLCELHKANRLTIVLHCLVVVITYLRTTYGPDDV
jgi:hypothetical protein